MKTRITTMPITVSLLVLLTACAGANRAPVLLAPSERVIRAALEQPTPARKISALKELLPVADGISELQIDIQTQIVFQALEIVPRDPKDREVFREEAASLASMVLAIPLHRMPEETGVLLYLAGRPARGMLASGVADTVDRFCGPAMNRVGAYEGEPLNRLAIRQANQELATSCRRYLDGDLLGSQIALSNAIKYQLSSRSQIIPVGITPSASGGWDIFKRRLERDAAIRLDASAERLLR